MNLDQTKLIGDALVQKFGYSVPSATKKKLVTVEGFQPLSKKQTSNLQKEIEGLQLPANNKIQKQIFPEYTKLVKKKIQEYNQIVSYKHIKQKTIQGQDSGLKDTQKNRQELIFQKIDEIKKELVKKQNVKDNIKQFRLNKQLNGLFKQYQKSIEKSINRSRQINSLNRSSNFYQPSPTNRYNTKSQMKNKNQNNTTNLETPRNNNFSTHRYTLSTDNNSRWESPSTINRRPKKIYEFQEERPKLNKFVQPFSKDNTISYLESEKVQHKIQNQKQVLDCWKQRIQQLRDISIKNKINTVQNCSLELNKTIIPTRKNHTYNGNQSYNIKDIKLLSKLFAQQQSEQSNTQIQKQIFSGVVRKKNQRFVKHKDTQILGEFNPNQTSKNLIGITTIDVEQVQSPRRLKKIYQKNSQVEDEQMKTYNTQVLDSPKRLPMLGGEYRKEKMNGLLRTIKKN